MTYKYHRSSHVLFSLLWLVAFADPLAAQDAAQKERERIEKWEPAIAEFEAQDLKSPPPPGAVLFVGSSTIKLWDTKASFPDLATVNRGFGGSQLADTLHFLDRLVIKHKPKIVVVHAGGNDLNGGKPPAQVAADLRGIVERLQSELPGVKVVFIGIKPTIALRKKLLDKERELNSMIRDFLKERKGCVFVEVDKPFCDDQGEPRANLLRDDKLHLNDAGYKVLSDLVRPYVVER